MSLDNESKTVIETIVEKVLDEHKELLNTFGEFTSNDEEKYAFIFGVVVGAVMETIESHYEAAYNRELNKKERKEAYDILLLRAPEVRKVMLGIKESH